MQEESRAKARKLLERARNRKGLLGTVAGLILALAAAPSACQTGGWSSLVDRGASVLRLGADRFGSVGGVRLLPPVESDHPGYFDVLVADFDDVGVSGNVHLVSCPVQTDRDLRRLQQFGVRISAIQTAEDPVHPEWGRRVAKRCRAKALPKSVRNSLGPLQEYAGSAVVAWLVERSQDMATEDVEELRDHVFGGGERFEVSTAWLRSNLAAIVGVLDLSEGELLDLRGDLGSADPASAAAFSLLPIADAQDGGPLDLESPEPTPAPASCEKCEESLKACLVLSADAGELVRSASSELRFSAAREHHEDVQTAFREIAQAHLLLKEIHE